MPTQGVDDPTMVDFPVQYYADQAKIIRASKDVWDAIARFVKARVLQAIAEQLANSTSLANVCVSMGTPGTALTASNTAPWAHVVVPFPASIVRIEYFFYPSGGSAAVDVRLVRPGQTLAEAASSHPGGVPSLADVTTRVLTGDTSWQSFVEAGTILVFYVTAASGGVELVTANVIMRTLG